MVTTEYNKNMHFFMDMQRCIGCQACVVACAECETNGQDSMIHVHYVDRANTIQTTMQVCMHCDDPVCANVCPSNAITKDASGVVLSANTARCLGCSNCVIACPFGVPIKNEESELMTKCNMCYDRTGAGLKPMCATVCPSSALFYGTLEEMEEKRPNSVPVNTFIFGDREVITKVNVMMPKGSTELKIH